MLPTTTGAPPALGFFGAFANLLKSMIGSGLLTLPYVTSKAGIGLSLPGLALCAYMTQEAIRYVVRCAIQERQLGGGAYDSCPAPENYLPAPLAGLGTCGQMLSVMIQAENIAM